MEEDNLPLQRAPAQRLEGIDLARALAVTGMLSVHIAPTESETLARTLYDLPNGRASLLFVLLAGIGISLASRKAARLADIRLKLAWTAGVLLLLGLALQMLDHGIAVILHYYALYFLVGIGLLGLSTRSLLIVALIWTALGPFLYLAGASLWPDTFERHIIALGDNPGAILLGLVISGYYPLLTWGPALVWGLWLGRMNLRDTRPRVIMITTGALLTALATATPAFDVQTEIPVDLHPMLDKSPHSQMFAWLVGGLGSAVAVVGLCLVLAERFPRLLQPLIALGQLALSFYVIHLLVLAMAGEFLRQQSVSGALLTGAIIIALAAPAALFWHRHFGIGPVERLTRAPWYMRGGA